MTKGKHILIVMAILLYLTGMGRVWAQYTTVETQQGFGGTTLTGSASILTPHQTTGRFGSTSLGGSIFPSPDQNSRFTTGAQYTQSGSFLGMTTNSANSRFQSVESMEQSMPSNSGIDYSLYRDFISMRRGEISPVEPLKQVQAQAPESLPYPARNSTPYYASGQYERDRQSASSVPVPSGPTTEPIRRTGETEQLWMRSTPRDTAGSANRAATNSVPKPLPGTNANDLDMGSRMVGHLTTPNITPANSAQPNSANAAVGPAPVPTPAPTARDNTAAFQEYLELMLLRNPNVNPLSPVQVLFQNGTATVRGIVPSQAHRLEAGRILLSDPRVKNVDNKLTILPSDTMKPLPGSFDPNLQK